MRPLAVCSGHLLPVLRHPPQSRSSAALPSCHCSELKGLVANYEQLKDAQQKFADSAAAIQALPTGPEERPMLVPLTSSLFVPGFMKGDSQLLVDIGTGYFVGAWVSATERRRNVYAPA